MTTIASGAHHADRIALEDLLSETIDAAEIRERSTYIQAAGDLANRIVLFGAGGLGRRTLAGLRKAGVEPLAMVDNNPERWGSDIEGVEVLSPELAAERFASSATFVVTIWGAGSPHRFEQSKAQLNKLGCAIVVPVAWLYWHYSDELLPFYALELPSKLLAAKDRVLMAFELLGDDFSCHEYVNQVRWRLSGDPSCLGHPVGGRQYLVADIATPHPGDIVLDCGAYDGDTMRDWIAERGPSFSAYIALEPDPLSRARLEASLSELPPDVANRVTVLAYSVSRTSGHATFAVSGSLSSALTSEDGLRVECRSIDDLAREIAPAVPTFIKLDIEGAELDALAGGAQLIASAQPMLAIASYHCQDHLFEVPLLIHELLATHELYMRPHNEEGWDLICYAVPASRAIGTRLRDGGSQS